MKAPNTSRLLTHLISFRKQCSDFEKTLMNGRCAHLIYKSPSISWICQTRNLSIHNHKPEFLARFTTKVQNVKGKRNLVRDNNGSSATWAITIILKPWLQAAAMKLVSTRKMYQCFPNLE